MLSNVRSRNRRRWVAGFTLIEILVATVLLAGSLAAMMTLWSVSRRITERSRDTAEYYAIARIELERFRTRSSTSSAFDVLVSTTWPKSQDYDQNGTPVTSGSTSAFYRATSTYSLVSTSPTSGVAEPAGKQLGVLTVVVYTMSNGSQGPEVYRTAGFFTSAGV
jgi:prepilin-type N-terminal cleavage/methylation domain-containing protein